MELEIHDKSNPKPYTPNPNRYQNMQYQRCGNSGILLPKISLGLWHNFGFYDSFENARNILKTAFDLGITHFDLANNYGPPYGSAEENFGRILKKDFAKHRDELLIATKAGYDMWPGPYGNMGSKKYLVASLDQSLQRMGLDYVDIYYHHRPDPETPLEETMHALSLLVQQGKALYIGLSRYSAEEMQQAQAILKKLGTPCLIHQSKYSMLERSMETEVFPVLEQEQIGAIVFSPLAQGLLTDKYLDGIPKDSRAAKENTYLASDTVSQQIEKVKALNQIARKRGQSMAQMAIAWIYQQAAVTTVLVGASSPQQLLANVGALEQTEFTSEEIQRIQAILNE
ncbi:L-glyceraldehyde 3-phosphate reductase [Pustulibacterium marinum]|uniref:L-glyceraldehyde 3-phosphate reductase n=1 Tax=Pustulibacterium marinum TaxID=1224947 RepID=A0A1I7GX28_9FLAO|nr:aldo/keto reductase [Pustulibacterium marinum]SFU53007.1 L-glyceraldehyde 3-phosphate reductase [Pustulibacterium marinum]